MNEKEYLTVSSLTKYIKYKFDIDNNLKNVFLKGEISNFKAHSTGHMYFSLKDEKSKINAIMFNFNAKKLNFKPQEGSKVLVVGKISVFEQTGAYQIYIDDMKEDGIGNLYVAFEKLKQDLQKEGLFDPKHKKPIPVFPKRVGVVTAPTGAAIRDILSTIKRRCNKTEVIVFPSLVQGENAKEDIVRNIKLAENYNLDVLIVGRGGGSIEDLWPFNEEIVARAIFECSIPVISGTGHEVDFTIADFVADYRAETPTGAAEKAVPNLKDMINYFDQFKIRLNESMNKKIEHKKLKLENIKNSYVIKNPMMIIENKIQKLDIVNEKIITLLNQKMEKTINTFINLSQKVLYLSPYNKLNNYNVKLQNLNEKINLISNQIIKNNINKVDNIKQKIEYLNPINKIEKYKKELKNYNDNLNKNINHILLIKQNKFKMILEKVEILNPIAILGRGYSITKKDNKVLNSVHNIKVNDELNVKLKDGNILVNVKEINGE
ncbi:MAG: exodeoxyribonuclease VII large subunit [Bacilli bacterium]|nr:exodeoxyribonuclease VII large subunit [Bacilli bacterium]